MAKRTITYQKPFWQNGWTSISRVILHCHSLVSKKEISLDIMRDVIIGLFFTERWNRVLFISIWIFISTTLFAQEGSPYALRIVSYNVENLFYPEDDPDIADDEFTINHYRRWGYSRYFRKISQISKAIVATFPYDYPDIVCLCEIENRQVLHDLIGSPLLRSANYSIVHRDGPDPRGIDVAFLVRKDKVYLDSISFVEIPFHEKYFREVVHVAVSWLGSRYHFWGLHLPSNYSGVKKSQQNRQRCMEYLCQQIAADRSNDCHFIMGDFNTEPTSSCIKYLVNQLGKKGEILNLICPNKKSPGTLRYHEFWFLYDMIYLWKKLPENVCVMEAKVCNFSFLMEQDSKYGGVKPKRFFIGYRCQEDGFSDHLPVSIELYFEH
ncbi:endonuclease/exonuclease/phosphatase family protein [Halosquirtibacter laminarini]|uniref:Endonuclease/exonuclease/phosphatase family protein n=1 Tax=Halosquirtibacter laminarini TaxID=3374600 RepID=A0AC61NFS1_9BACT|nr:endonuclease/exonuclease/phosphatase family protein [Prolixibacteraceae bacterium]